MAAFPIAETDDYVRKILGRAGPLPTGDADALFEALVPHVMHQESGGNPRAVSKVGAVGTMQTMPKTLRDPGFGVKPAQDDSDAERERVGKDYLRAMIDRYPGRPDLALAAYNAGPARADKWAAQGGAAVNPTAPAGENRLFRADSGAEGITPLAPDWAELRKREDEPQHGTLGDYFSNIVGLDSSIGSVARIFEDSGYEYDPNFNIAAIPKKDWEQITAGIPEEYQAGLGSAASRAHLEILAARTRAQLHAEEELAAYGGWGVAGRFALNMADPLSLAVAIGTGGIGDIGIVSERLAKAAQIATRAGKFAESRAAIATLESIAKGSAWKGAGRAAVYAGVENAGIEALLDHGNVTRDGWDVAFAGLTGAALGGTASRVFHGRALADVQDAFLRSRDALRIAELEHHISTRQAELDVKLKWLHADADVSRAKAELASIEDHVAGLRAEHATALRSAADERRQSLTRTADGALKRSELGALRRSTEGLRRQAKDADNLEPQIRERMLREDIEALGDEAHSKQRTKHRNAAAKAEAAARKETITSNLQRAETALARHTAAEDARVELRKVERRERSFPNDPLQTLDEPGRNAFAEREQALAAKLEGMLSAGRAGLKAATDKVEAKRASLEAEKANLENVRQAGVQAIDADTLKAAEAFGRDTAGAARFDGFVESVHPHLEDMDSGLPKVAQMGAQGKRGKVVDALMARRGPLATISMVLRGSPNEKVRTLLGRMVGNSVGTKDGSATTVGGSEIAHTLRQRMAAKFYSAVEPAYTDWAERHGYSMYSRWTRPVRDEFMSDVGRAVRGDETKLDPAVRKAAAEHAKIYAEFVDEAKAAGVKGFEELEHNPHYLPRVFDFKSLKAIEDRIGTPNLRKLIQGGIQAIHEDMPDRTAAKIAQAYVQRMKELRVGSDVGLMQGMKWDDVGFLRRFLEDAKLSRDDIDDVVNEMAALNARRQRQTEGSFRNAKHRVQFDENFSMKFKDQQALKQGRDEDVEVRIADLFENNVEALFGRYNRSVSGHIGLAKVGIKSRNDFDDSLNAVRSELENDIPELDRVIDTADVTYKLITGQPIEKATSLTRLGRAARDYNFATTMGQSGWAQFPDLAGLLQRGYFSYTMKHFPEVFGAARRRVDGHIDDAFYREQEEWLGLGTDLHNNQVFSSYDAIDEGNALGSAEHGLRVAGRGVQIASGLGWMTQFSQRMVGRVIVQRLVKDVLEDGGDLAEHRALQLGLTGDMKKRIAAQLREHTEFANGDFGGKVRIVNYGKWNDVDARDALLHAVSKESRRMVQEEDLGDTALWMHSNLGKIVAQFRRFAMVSYSKQLLHGIAHADAEEFTRVMVSGVMAAMAYQARHMTKIAQMEFAGASDEQIADYREKFLSTDRLVAATIANSTYSSVLPGLWDSTVGLATGKRFFNTRNSDLAADLFTGNPTYSLVRNLSNAVGGSAQSILRGDEVFDQKDAQAWRKLLPFQNVLGMDIPYTALTADLPEKDEDPDPDRIDWFLNDSQ